MGSTPHSSAHVHARPTPLARSSLRLGAATAGGARHTRTMQSFDRSAAVGHHTWQACVMAGRGVGEPSRSSECGSVSCAHDGQVPTSTGRGLLMLKAQPRSHTHTPVQITAAWRDPQWTSPLLCDSWCEWVRASAYHPNLRGWRAGHGCSPPHHMQPLFASGSTHRLDTSPAATASQRVHAPASCAPLALMSKPPPPGHPLLDRRC